MKKLLLGVTLGGSSRLLDGQAKYFKDLGYDVYLISEDHDKETLFCKREGIKHVPVKIVADINPLKDLKSLFQITKEIKKLKPDVINVGTPKIALLGLMAAYYLGIKKRIYTCRGLRFETETGLKRKILLMMELLTVKLATKVIYVSPSLMKAAVDNKVAVKEKSVLIGKGSSNGVNVDAFNKDKIDLIKRTQLINNFKLNNCIVIGFVGRVSLHKGAYELVEAFEEIYLKNKNVRLILMGHIKCESAFEEKFKSHPGIIHIPFQDDVPLYMSLFDIFVLPSWREGFPNVPIQAASMGIPVVVSDSTGCVDSVSDNFNGKVFKTRNTNQLQEILEIYINDDNLRQEHGSNGASWSKKFNQNEIWHGINNIYENN